MSNVDDVNNEGSDTNGEPPTEQPPEPKEPKAAPRLPPGQEPNGVKPVIQVQQGPDGRIQWTDEAVARMRTSKRLGPYMAVGLDGGHVDLRELHAALRSENIEIIAPKVVRPQAPMLPEGARVIEGGRAPAPAPTEAAPIAATPAPDEASAPPAKANGIALTKKQVLQLLHEVDLRLLLDVAGVRLTHEMEEQFPGCELAMVVDTETGLYVAINIPADEDGSDGEGEAGEAEVYTADPITLAHTKAGTPFDKLGSATAQVFAAAVPERDRVAEEQRAEAEAAATVETRRSVVRRPAGGRPKKP